MANSKQYTVTTSADVAAATSSKTMLAIVNSASTSLVLTELEWSNDWTVTAGAFLLELVEFDQTTAGTPGAAETVQKVGGTAVASLVTSVQRGYTAEPTTGTVKRTLYVPVGGVYSVQYPLGREYQLAPSKTLGLRVKSPSGTPNMRATLSWEE
jgi:hypothetical protein